MSKQVNTADEQDEIQHMDYIYMVNDDKLMIRMNAELDHHLAEEMRQVIDGFYGQCRNRTYYGALQEGYG